MVLERVKRVFSPPTDEKWPQQWYLVCTHVLDLPKIKRGGIIGNFSAIILTFNLLPDPQHRKNGHDMNVQLAWEQNITGRGSVVTILDDGMWF